MRLSIRNQFPATIVGVVPGQVMGTVKARLHGGQEITAAITLEAIHDLGLTDGAAAQILIKSTEVSIATGPIDGLSIRNQIPGTIRAVDHGAVMTSVKVDIGGGDILTAAITKESAEDLKLVEGDPVTALVKSTEVSVATA
ncbi:MAG TPA: TOBE domain-containing protein [Rugosimonospora sp.]|nr:TOBE domain-containing protein [Rugosimonospora sp.]